MITGVRENKIKRKNSWGNKVMKVIGMIVGICFLFLVGITLFYWIKSPGKMIQYTDESGAVLENSIASKEYVEINGTKLGMIIKSKDLSNPVLLFLHGGIGMPEYPATYQYQIHLEDYFTVVWLEQRGAGLSYNSQIEPEEITSEQYISDTIEVSKYLCQRFDVDQIYLMAHSGGTYTGIQAASRAPELYKAYIGISQIVDEDQSEVLAYNYMVDYFTEKGQMGDVKRLKTSYGTKNYGMVEERMMCKAGIETTRETRSQFQSIFLPTMDTPEYTLGEKINIWRGLILGKKSPLSKESNQEKIIDHVSKLEIPVYFFSGKYDYITNAQLVRQYAQEIEAPVKGYYLFEDSAHAPIFEEPEKMLKILNEDVKKGTNTLADNL